MTNPDPSDRTAGGLAGKLAGKVKAAAGSVLGHDELSREGRLQEAQSEAEIAARREEAQAEQRQAEADLEAERNETEQERARLQAEVAQANREEQIERDRREAEQDASAEAARRTAGAEAQRTAGESAVAQDERRGEAELREAEQQAARLEHDVQVRNRRDDQRPHATEPGWGTKPAPYDPFCSPPAPAGGLPLRSRAARGTGTAHRPTRPGRRPR